MHCIVLSQRFAESPTPTAAQLLSRPGLSGASPAVSCINPRIAVVFLKTPCNWEGGLLPPGVSQVLCHLEIKFQRLCPYF